ncbi:MAG: ABC transporter substrate-binding protein [Verrucomicrobiota bacterium]
MKRIPHLVMTALLALGVAAHAQNEIKIGVYASLTGGQASYGISQNNAIQLGAEEINAAGGVLGKPIKLIVEDDRSTPGESATIVRKLIANDKVVAILGEFASSRSLEGGPICQENKIPMISPGSTNPKVTEIGDYIFRTCFMDSFQGTVMAKFALAKGYKSAAVLTDEKQAYSKGLAQYFREVFTQNGGQIVKEQSYSSGDKDFRAQLTSLKSAKPDVVFLPGYYNEVALIARQARQFGLKAPFLGGDGWEGDSLLKVAGNALDGCYFSSHFSADNQDPTVQGFIQKYKAKYGLAPDCQAALGYDTVRLVAQAIQRAGSTDSAAIRDAVAATKDFAGVTGKITIDAGRNASKPAVVQTIGGGGFKFVENVEP